MDCSARKTVHGEVWLEEYLKSLTEEDKINVKKYSSKSVHRFGDGEQVQATNGVSIPAVIGNTKFKINTDIIPKDLPLLLSKSFMKMADKVLDFNTGTAKALGETVQLATTSTGHYTILLPCPCQVITKIDKGDECKYILISREMQSNLKIAEKLHHQFAHLSINKML